MRIRVLALLIAAIACGRVSQGALNIQFDYTYDTNNFFSGANISRRNLLTAAAQVFTGRISDSLSAITPSGGNSWSATFDNPSSGASLSISNLSIAANTVVIFVGAQNLGGSTLGEGGPGGWSGSGSSAWLDTLTARGQAGALAATPTDFGPWGGAITFDLNSPWYFDSDPSTVESFSGQDDFYSVAVHEMAHLLGFGTADSWNAQVSGSKFTGANSTAANGGLQVSLSADLSHWAQGTTSTIYGTSTTQETDMDPSITVGTRKYFTTLDYAGLKDVGWQVAPEPGTWILFASGVAALAFARRRVV